MGALEEMILGYFARDNWQVQQHEAEPYIRFEYGNEDGSWVCLIWHIEDDAQILIYSILSVQVPVARRADVAEFIVRANYGRALGCFELNYDTGETRYRTSVDFGAGDITPAPFVPALKTNLLCFGDHLKALEDVIAGRVDPASAVATVLADQPDLDFRDDGY
ncbi:MAG: YbjN domain-containing protein [Roseobacter sp.]